MGKGAAAGRGRSRSRSKSSKSKSSKSRSKSSSKGKRGARSQSKSSKSKKKGKKKKKQRRRRRDSDDSDDDDDDDDDYDDEDAAYLDDDDDDDDSEDFDKDEDFDDEDGDDSELDDLRRADKKSKKRPITFGSSGKGEAVPNEIVFAEYYRELIEKRNKSGENSVADRMFGEFQELVRRANKASGKSTRGQLTTKQFRSQLNTPRFRDLDIDADELDVVVDKIDVNEDGILDFATFISFISMTWQALDRLAITVAKRLRRNARSQNRFEDKTWAKVKDAKKTEGGEEIASPAKFADFVCNDLGLTNGLTPGEAVGH